ncbi:uncharacterized protein LOC143291220 isoform X2 [Babylonia areolata]
MNSSPFKPDKSDAPSLQDTVSQLQQHISLSSASSNKPSTAAPSTAASAQPESGSSSEAVQQSQVSSSKPSIVATDFLGSLLLEALEGFIFVVNSQGKVEFVSETVTQYLQYTQDDLCGKSIYNIIHVGDHAQFSNSLVPMSLATSLTWPNDSPQKSRSFTCRMLVKPPCEEDDDVEVKQTYVSQYESMHITALLQPYKFPEVHSDSDNPTCLVCIARRVPMTEKVNAMISLNQFTTKQDLQGNILVFDVRDLSKSQYGEVSLTGKLQDHCHQNDLSLLRKHLQEVANNGSNTSGVYRFKLQDNHYVFVQTKSKMFFGANQSPEYTISTHCIIRECDSEGELKGSASTSLMKSLVGQSGSFHHLSLPGLPPNPSGGFSMLTLPTTSTLPPAMGGVGGGMGGAMPISSPSPSLLGVSGGSMDSLSEFDFLASELDCLNSLGEGMVGGFNGDLGMPQQQQQQQQQQVGFLPTSGVGGMGAWGGGGGLPPGLKPSPPAPNSGGGIATPASLQSALLNNQQPMGGGGLPPNSKPPHPTNPMAQRSSSLNYEGQKSPRFTPSPGTAGPRGGPGSVGGGGGGGGGFSLPAQRGAMAYPGQRSPGSAAPGGVAMMQNRSHGGQFSMGYRKPVSPLVSPQSAIPPSPIWGRSPTGMGGGSNNSASDFGGGMGGPGSVGSMVSSQPSPLQALQSMDGSQTPGGAGAGGPPLDMLASSSPMGRGGLHHDFPASTPPYDASPGGVGGSDVRSSSSGQRPGKLCQLLTQNNTLDPLGLRTSSSSAVPRPSSTKSSVAAASSMATTSPGRSKSGIKSPDDSFHQSPTPGPGTSPPEKPQSTSNEDGDGGVGGGGDGGEKKDNFILKKLLSQDDDGELPSIMDQEISSSPLTSGGGPSSSASAPASSGGDGDRDKNEAEPKKTTNVLLKQLLSDEKGKDQHSVLLHKSVVQEIFGAQDPGGAGPPTPGGRRQQQQQQTSSAGAAGAGAGIQGELLQHLLQREAKSGGGNQSSITSAPAESTSEDVNGSRSRHQSGQQEPQSTTSLPLTPSPSQHLGGMGGGGVAPPSVSSQQQQHHHQQQMMSELFMDSKPSAMPTSLSLPTASSSSSSTSSSASATGRKHSADVKNLDQMLKEIWEASDSPTGGVPTNQGKGGRKRKAQPPDVDSTEDAECSTSAGGGGGGGGSVVGGPTASKLSQKNALLAQLLAKKAAKETVVNTQLTVNPMGLPQNRIPKNIHERILNVKERVNEASSSSGGGGEPGGSGAVMVSSSNSNANPRPGNGPFPGNNSTPANPDSTAMAGSSGLVGGEGEQCASSQLDAVLSQLGVTMDGGDSQDKDSSSEDRLLQQILNQAAILREDFGLPPSNPDLASDISSTQPPPPPSVHPTPSAPSSAATSGGLQQDLSLTAVDPEEQSTWLQLEQMLDEGTIQTIESLLLDSVSTSSSSSSALRLDGQGPGSSSGSNNSFVDQMAIRDIERQLMSDQPPPPPPPPPQPNSAAIPGGGAGGLPPMGGGGGGPLRSPPTPGVYPPSGMANSPVSPVGGMGGPRGMMPGPGAPPPRHPQMLSQLQMGPRTFSPSQMSPQQQQQSQQQVSAMSPGQQPPAGPMFSPTGIPQHAAAFQQPVPRGPMGGASLQAGQQSYAPRTSQQVRHNLLRQQVNRALEKQRQVTERQRMMQMQHRLSLQQSMPQAQQQQQQQQAASQQFAQRFPTQPMPTMESGTSPGQFPENLRDLMNTGHAPNVTIPPQRGGVVAGPPVSPRLPPLPPSAMSGHHLGQWGVGEAMPSLHPPAPQGAQFSGLQRHRSLSGNNIPNSGAPPQGARFQFPAEGQFSGQGQGQMGPMFSPGQGQAPPGSTAAQQQQQQQHLFQQNRMLQRSLSMNTGGRGSPRTSQSPFTGSPDPLLLSPHAMSPNSALRQQQAQVSPPFSQGTMTSSGFNPAGPPAYSGSVSSSGGGGGATFSPPAPHVPLAGPAPTSSSSQPFPDFSDFPEFMNTSLPDSKKMTGDLPMGNTQSTVQQYVKQELRIICSARSEKNIQHLQQQQHNQQQQQQAATPTTTTEATTATTTATATVHSAVNAATLCEF